MTLRTKAIFNFVQFGDIQLRSKSIITARHQTFNFIDNPSKFYINLVDDE